MIAPEFVKYETTKQVWDHLAKRYIIPNPARKYKLNSMLSVTLWYNQFLTLILVCQLFGNS